MPLAPRWSAPVDRQTVRGLAAVLGTSNAEAHRAGSSPIISTRPSPHNRATRLPALQVPWLGQSVKLAGGFTIAAGDASFSAVVALQLPKPKMCAMSPLYPLRFRPILRRYIWGGRKLGSVLGKELGEGDDYAESWEVVDHGEDQSVVTDGPLAGATLAELVAGRGPELFGMHPPQPRFPLLLKFLDANRKLSLQVHPDDQRARRLDPPDLGKTEAWVVLAAEPDSVIYAGLKPGVDRQQLAQHIQQGAAQESVHRFQPRPGDCVFLPSGVVHAIGAGLLIAEIQQASDTTYRLFDWNRVGADGQPRPLHIEQGLEATDYAAGPVYPQPPRPTGQSHIERLVECEKFVLDRWRLDGPRTLGGDHRFHIVSVIEGQLTVAGDAGKQPLAKGSTVLLPAAVGEVELSPLGAVEFLDAYLPQDFSKA